MFSDYHNKFPHFLLLIELCLTMSLSSSTVERGFSTVKRHLNDSRLSLKNASLNDLLIIKLNTPALKQLDPDYERKVVQKAVYMYMSERGRYHKTTTKNSDIPVSGPSASDEDISSTVFISIN